MSQMDTMMEDAIGAAFGKTMQDSLQPILTRLTDLEVRINVLISQQTELLNTIENLRTNGNPVIRKLLGG